MEGLNLNLKCFGMSLSKLEFNSQQMAYLIKKAAEGDANHDLVL